MATKLSVEAMVAYNAPAANKRPSSDDEGETSTTDPHSRRVSSGSDGGSDDAVEEAKLSWQSETSTTDPHSRQVSSDSKDDSDGAVEEARPGWQTSRGRPALDGVLASLPHFREACSDECDEDDDVVLNIAQFARRLALGGEANA